MKRLFYFSSLICLLFVSNVFAQIEGGQTPNAVAPETQELVRRLLEANGTRASLIRIFEDIIKRAPADSQKQLQEVLKSDAIIDNIIPVYAKHFTPAELKELIAFYKSPVGAKNLALTPKLMSEVMQVSAQYFENHTKVLEKPAQSR